jgi:3-hydroxyanthranilate 3,4-dioxygenase
MERQRQHGETDHLRWYCDACCAIVYEESFFCTDLGSQLKVAARCLAPRPHPHLLPPIPPPFPLQPVIERYVSTESLRVCKACGHANTPFTAQAQPTPTSDQ